MHQIDLVSCFTMSIAATCTLVAECLPGLMILGTLLVYVGLFLKKRLMKKDPLLENEEGTGKSSMSHSIEIEKDYQHPNHDQPRHGGGGGGGKSHQKPNQHH